jgi:hypothetical protein
MTASGYYLIGLFTPVLIWFIAGVVIMARSWLGKS